MNYNQTQECFYAYTDKCKEIIKQTFFSQEDRQELHLQNKSDWEQKVEDHRMKLIDIKIDHTMRMIDQIIKINEQLNLKFDFRLVMKIAILYHDIGRFEQMTWSNTFNDDACHKKRSTFIDHGQEGSKIFLSNNFKIDEQYIPLIGATIYHHVKPENMPKADYQFKKELSKININDIITGNFELNDSEMKVAVLITQLVADIDKIDILYQQLDASAEMIKDYILDDSYDTLDNISKYWGISKTEIIEANQIQENKYQPRVIKIPTKNMELSKLEIRPEMKEMFYNNSWIPLPELQKDRHWNFISVIWWRLSYFLNHINFQPVLATVEATNLLKLMEEKVPERLKPLTNEAFEYAQEKLVSKVLIENENNLYIKRR